jgi:hypothetical protein|eukprot:CAMPEP_0169352860 /NCGR_PEP_ID=MMETSP1017-20121227/25564_1 /TAXON_ID=342587 /ORGANISM="Karlodinium micrum, Strain CCMP2283" /LENGTH=52 /DNA_ID=CAMNT_0009449269 /DNA_START=246 /DNA_END=404 /DNA_ORIENTATION=+
MIARKTSEADHKKDSVVTAKIRMIAVKTAEVDATSAKDRLAKILLSLTAQHV